MALSRPGCQPYTAAGAPMALALTATPMSAYAKAKGSKVLIKAVSADAPTIGHPVQSCIINHCPGFVCQATVAFARPESCTVSAHNYILGAIRNHCLVGDYVY